MSSTPGTQRGRSDRLDPPALNAETGSADLAQAERAVTSSGALERSGAEPAPIEPSGSALLDVEPAHSDTVEPARSDTVETEPAGAVALFQGRVGIARRYVHALATDGVVRGLIGPRERGKLWTRHVLNSVAIAPLIGEGATVVDIGSGAGLPGIPLAIARADLSMTLIEPLERRVRFLLEVVNALQLTNCRVIRGRAEDVIAEAGGADVVTSRAVAPLHRLAGWSAPLIRDNGLLLAIKGSSALDELDRDRAAVTTAGLTNAEVIELEDALGAATYVIRASRTTAARRPTGPRPRRSRR